MFGTSMSGVRPQPLSRVPQPVQSGAGARTHSFNASNACARAVANGIVN